MVLYILSVENFQNYILTHSCLPIAGRLFYIVRKISWTQDLRVAYRQQFAPLPYQLYMSPIQMQNPILTSLHADHVVTKKIMHTGDHLIS